MSTSPSNASTSGTYDSDCSRSPSRAKSRRMSQGPLLLILANKIGRMRMLYQLKHGLILMKRIRVGKGYQSKKKTQLLKRATQKETSTLPNPHGHIRRRQVYVMFDSLAWWKDKRTHILPQEEKDDLLEIFKQDSSIEEYFKAPDMPQPIKLAMKKGRAI